MANWHLVFPYDSRATEWLTAQGLPHPQLRPDNRLPTPAGIESAARDLGFGPHVSLLVDWLGSNDSFSIRGDLYLELKLIRKLAEACGQLWVYPDCGSPAIVVDSGINPHTVGDAWLAALDTEDPWSSFHRALYSSQFADP